MISAPGIRKCHAPFIQFASLIVEMGPSLAFTEFININPNAGLKASTSFDGPWTQHVLPFRHVCTESVKQPDKWPLKLLSLLVV